MALCEMLGGAGKKKYIEDEKDAPITCTKTKDSVELSGTIFELLASTALVNDVVFEARIERGTGSVAQSAFVGFDGEDTQVLSRGIQTWNGPGFKGSTLVAFDQSIEQVFP